MKARELREDEVTFSIAIEEDDIDPDGCFASDDAAADKALVKSIRKRLRDGDTWAWACVTVTATWKGYRGTDTLGACSYESEEDFKASGGYFDDMKASALAELNRAIQNCAEEIGELVSEPESFADHWIGRKVKAEYEGRTLLGDVRGVMNDSRRLDVRYFNGHQWPFWPLATEVEVI